jgi:UDP-arabinose 4-epimerase
MRVLVTGGAGYIGSQTCKVLAESGHEPVVFDDLSQGHRWAVRWGELVVGNIADGALLRRTMAGERIDAVIHFAGSANVGESMQHPVKYFVNNTVGSMALLDAMMGAGVSRIVFSSTCATYGLPIRTPLDETHPTAPLSPYGESKLAVEKALRWLGLLNGLKWVALRYFNAAGADPDGMVGEVHEPETHLIPLALRAAAPGDYRLRIFGTDYPTPDGTAIRDYIHVADLARAHVVALEMLERDGLNDVVNLGSGKGVSVLEVVSAVERVTGSSVRRVAAPRREGDPPALVADLSKARQLLSWMPQRSDLQTIVADAWRWQQKMSALAG